MIDRKQITLVEVEPEEYTHLKISLVEKARDWLTNGGNEGGGLDSILNGHSKWAENVARLRVEAEAIFKKHKRKSKWRNKGFARIEQPLEYDSYTELIKEFLQTTFAKRVSVCTDEGWVRRYVKDFYIGGILDLGEVLKMDLLATKKRFMYIHFYSTIDGVVRSQRQYEIGFMNYGNRIVSTDLSIPGYSRNDFNWIGGNSHYPMIHGLWYPTDIKGDRRIEAVPTIGHLDIV